MRTADEIRAEIAIQKYNTQEALSKYKTENDKLDVLTKELFTLETGIKIGTIVKADNRRRYIVSRIAIISNSLRLGGIALRVDGTPGNTLHEIWQGGVADGEYTDEIPERFL